MDGFIMLRRVDSKPIALITLVLLVLFLAPLLSVEPVNESKAAVSSKINEIPIEFSHSEDFSIAVGEYQVEAEGFNGSEFLEGLNTFNLTGADVFMGSDLIPNFAGSIPGSSNLYYLTVNITESYIKSDHDSGIGSLGYGEIYFKIWVNGNYTRYPESGEISVDDDTTLDMDVIAFQGWTWNTTVMIEVWESDFPDPDENLGKITYTTENLENSTIEFQTDIGDANATIKFIVTDTKTTITAEELLWGYQPYLYIDDETSGTEGPNGIYGRVCIGYDNEVATTLWALQYFFFWEKETFGSGLAEIQIHKYDYEEFLIFLDPADITKPVRIVFDQAQNPLYPEHEYAIYESNPAATGNFNQTVNFTESFHPFLGTNLTIDYTVYDLSSLNTDFIPSQLGAQTLKLTIDTFYHAFDSGEGSNETSYHYEVQELTDSILKDWYGHLNESLNGNILNIPVIDYTTPEISPFTFDVSNPFQRPYLINAWSNVMDDLDAFANAQTTDITIAAELNITVTMAIEGLLTIEYPETVLPGESYHLNYSIEMYDDKLKLETAYDLGLNVSTNFWFLGGDFQILQNGSFTVNVPLSTINSLLDALGISHQDFADKIVDKINQYLPIDYLELEHMLVSPQLLGTVLNASTRLHLWNLAKDYIPPIVSTLAPQIYPAITVLFKILDKIISHIDIQAQFILQTMITGDISLSDTNQAQLSQSTIEFNESAAEVPIGLTIATTPTNPNLQVTLNNISNGVNFFIDWYFDAGLEEPFSYFIDDFRIYIGQYPSYEMALPEGLIEANVSSITIDMSISGVSEIPVFNFLALNSITIAIIALVLRRKKKS